MTIYHLDFDESLKEAQEAGFSVVRGNPCRLLLDLDSEPEKQQFKQMLPLVNQHLQLKVSERWPSKSGKGEHVVLDLPCSLEIKDRILLQLVLGSDPKHEALAYLVGLRTGNPEPCVLFKPGPQGGAQ